MRSIVRLYINSEQDKDKERAMELCKRYKLDYVHMRYVILNEMIEESRKLKKSWTPAAGSRPQSPWPPIDRAPDAQEETPTQCSTTS